MPGKPHLEADGKLNAYRILGIARGFLRLLFAHRRVLKGMQTELQHNHVVVFVALHGWQKGAGHTPEPPKAEKQIRQETRSCEVQPAEGTARPGGGDKKQFIV